MPDPRGVPRLILITPGRHDAAEIVSLAERAARGGIDALQIREHGMTAKDLAMLAETLKFGIGQTIPVIVNTHLRVAAELHLGIHLRQDGPAVAEVQRLVGNDVLIGRSVHTAVAARVAVGVDYLIAGHVFTTASKPGQPPIGLSGLNAIANATDLPVLAIGGITAANVADCLAAGAHGVAVISAIADAPDPESAARELRRIIDLTPV